MVYTVNESDTGMRLDAFLAKVTGESRSAAVRAIDDGRVNVCGRAEDKKYSVKLGDEVSFTETEAEEYEATPENIPLNIVYEDTFVYVRVVDTDENNQVKFEHQFRDGVYFTATPKYEAVSSDVFVPEEMVDNNNNFAGVFDLYTSSNVYMIWETDESEKRIEAGDYKATVTFNIGLEMKDNG